MGLLDEIVAEQGEARCKFARILEELDPDDRAGLEQALSRPDISRISIVNVLTRKGLAVDRDTMSRHTRGKCVCFR